MTRAGMLLSYHYLKPEKAVASFLRSHKRYPHVGWVLDSGAFSAMSVGAQIDIDAYARFIKAHGWRFDWCASLDVIGDPIRSRRNWLALREMSGVAVVPCVHVGTTPTEVDWYASKGAKRIAFGGLVPHLSTLRHHITDPSHPVVSWLDAAHASAKRHSLRTHGFGVGSAAIVCRWPWTTTDSTSPLMVVTRRQVEMREDGVKVDPTTRLSPEQMRRAFSSFEVNTTTAVGRGERIRLAVFNTMAKLSEAAQTGYESFYFAFAPSGSYCDIENFPRHGSTWNKQ